jgi:competence protein ComEA
MSDGSIRDRLAMLSRTELFGLVAIVFATLGGAALWYTRSLPRPVEVRAGPSAAAESASPSAEAAPLIVDVAGAVRQPGVYRFAEGDRVIDAIQAAGGPTAKAALQALNLAAPLTDGVQILVPKEASAGAGAPVAAGGSAGGAPALINVNTATAPELEALPGVGPVISQRIVDYREANGPFATVDDLEKVSGIGPVTLENMRELVTV